MCAIVGSRDRDTLIDLVNLNSYRGSHSHSVSLYDIKTGKMILCKRDFGMPDMGYFDIPEDNYAIVHIQAPTTEAKDMNSIHPATVGNIRDFIPDHALWHNGIIKESVVKRYESIYNTKWDTKQILLSLVKEWGEFNTLNEMDGTFSCLYYNKELGKLFIFRNEISPMFIDSKLNISSTKFDGSESTNPNKVLQLNFTDNIITDIGKFTTVENPYYFGE
jgi:glutamine phosphoribosylpyrophosphate amidotransferase